MEAAVTSLNEEELVETTYTPESASKLGVLGLNNPGSNDTPEAPFVLTKLDDLRMIW